MTEPELRRMPTHMLSELGLGIRHHDDALHGKAEIIPEMHVPGTEHMRTSVLAVWADMLSGMLAAHSMGGRVPVTLELDIHLYRPAPGTGAVRATGVPIKQGRTVFVASVEFTAGDGEPFAFGSASFMSAPDPTARFPVPFSFDLLPPLQTLSVPLAERARCERLSPGVATLPRSEDGLNSSNTVNGGLIALVVEEAALSLSPGDTLTALDIRYLQPVRTGPVVATAQTRAGLGQVEVRDAGSDDRLAAIATTRVFRP